MTPEQFATLVTDWLVAIFGVGIAGLVVWFLLRETWRWLR